MTLSMPGAKINRVADFLGLKRNILILLGAIVFASTGERLWLGFAPKYLETLGAGVFLIGLFDALQTILGALYAYPGAWLTDKLGQRNSLIGFSIISVIGYLIVYFWPSRFALLVGTFFFTAWSALSLPATFSVVASQLKKEKHTMGIGVQSLIRRIPMMLGPLIGGWLIMRKGWEGGVRSALLLCTALSLLTVLLQLLMVNDTPAAVERKENGFLTVFRAFPSNLKELLLSDILIRFCERIPYAFVVLWVVNKNGLSAADFGTLVAIEMAAAMLCYIPVAHLADKYGKGPFVLATFIFFTMFPLSLIGARSFPLLAIAFAVRGLKEFGEPARKALIISYAPPDLKSKAYGVYYLVRDCVVTIGSFAGAVLWKISPEANFIGAAACGLLGTFWFCFFIIRKNRKVSV